MDDVVGREMVTSEVGGVEEEMEGVDGVVFLGGVGVGVGVNFDRRNGLGGGEGCSWGGFCT